MTPLLSMAARSAWNRRFVLSLIVSSIALSTFLLLAIDRIRSDVRENFAQSVSATDLIVGARTGSVQLLLYSVFRIGSATNNIRWSTVQEIAKNRAVAWVVPISLGDSHRGFPVVATSLAYFDHFEYGDHQRLELAQGKRFAGVFDTVLGAEVASKLHYKLGDHIILAHGDGVFTANDHADKPFRVVGILARTGTPVDRSVHISLEAMEAIHLDWMAGAPIPGTSIPAGEVTRYDLTPKNVTAALIGLKSRAAVFSVQRAISEFDAEPVMAILPGVALDGLWDVVDVGERALVAMSALVAVVSLAGLVAVIMAGLNERRRELAILRSVGAGPRHVLLLLALEGAFVTAAGVAIGCVVATLAVVLLSGWFVERFGIALHLRAPGTGELALVVAILVAGWVASLIPGYRAYRLSLADGLSPRI